MAKLPSKNLDRQARRAALKERLYRRRFVVPNAVTTGNMFCGFLSCVYAAAGHLDKACMAIGFAILLDGLDGRVARRLNATSRFGVEFDSFSDLVSFGIAPAVLIYYWCYKPIADDFGVFASFIYALCAASRLARFNIAPENLKGFMGLPTPGAAGVVAATVNLTAEPVNSVPVACLGTAILWTLSYLMVSRIEFFSIKTLRVNSLGFFARILIGALIALIWYNNRLGFLILASAYGLSGPFKEFKREWVRWKAGSARIEESVPRIGDLADQPEPPPPPH